MFCSSLFILSVLLHVRPTLQAEIIMHFTKYVKIALTQKSSKTMQTSSAEDISDEDIRPKRKGMNTNDEILIKFRGEGIFARGGLPGGGCVCLWGGVCPGGVCQNPLPP